MESHPTVCSRITSSVTPKLLVRKTRIAIGETGMTGTGARQHAMERSVEVDKFHFLVLARESSAKAHRRRSFRAIQGRARRHQRNARKECLWTASSPTGSLGDPVQFLVARDSANV